MFCLEHSFKEVLDELAKKFKDYKLQKTMYKIRPNYFVSSFVMLIGPRTKLTSIGSDVLTYTYIGYKPT